MKDLIKKFSVSLLFAGFIAIAAGLVPALAEESPQTDTDKAIQNLSRRDKIAELKKLKEEDPAEFERVVRERKQKVKAELMELKEKDPQEFEEMKKKIGGHRKNYLKKLSYQDPEKFDQIMRNKAARLKELRTEDPERFEEILRNHPHLRERFEGRGPYHDHYQDHKNRPPDFREDSDENDRD